MLPRVRTIMGKYRTGLEMLEERNTMAIVLALNQRGSMLKTEIYRAVSANASMAIKIDMLEDAGIIAMAKEDRRYRLTDEGTVIAGDLIRLRDHILRAAMH